MRRFSTRDGCECEGGSRTASQGEPDDGNLKQAEKTPLATAVSVGETEMTYAEISGQAELLAETFRALGVRRETCVGVVATRSAETVVAFLGVLLSAVLTFPSRLIVPAKESGHSDRRGN